MFEQTSDQELISEEKAKTLSDLYLHERYFDFEKLTFTSIENGFIDKTPIYRLHGTVKVKSRSMFERLLFDNNANIYKFMVEMNATNGHIINYEFQ
ncbi:MAG: hypothetical protein JXA01_04480 [Dehalococcoidia bacterium]|nr:hypothetical protein [Dehalococcoidia bacterium]